MLTNPPRSVAFIVGQLGLGGAERQLYILLKGLIRKGWRAAVLTLHPNKADYWEKPIRDLGIPVIAIPHVTPIFRAIILSIKLAMLGPDVVHSWLVYANPYASTAGRLAGIPVKLGSDRNHPDLWKESRIFRNFALRGLDGIVVNSRAAFDAMENFISQNNPVPVYLVRNAVPLPEPVDRLSLRSVLSQKWHINTAVPWVAAVGRMYPVKNWEMLLDACRIVKNNHKNFQVVFVGDGIDRPNLEFKCHNLGLNDVVRFVGKYPDIANHLPAFDILCLTSLFEGMPNVVMEASAAGLPVLATAVGGTPEIVDHGHSGFLILPKDVQGLAESLCKLIIDPGLRGHFGSCGAEKMKTLFGEDQMVDNMITIYEEIFRRKCTVH